jgi:hypothetical protein
VGLRALALGYTTAPMFPFPKPRLSYANVIATLALVFSMTGGAMAAQHYLINSTSQINPAVLGTLRGSQTTAFTMNSGSGAVYFAPHPGQVVTVAELVLPRGRYSVFAKLIADNDGPPALARCELILGEAAIDPGFNGVGLPLAPGDRQYFVLAGTGSLKRPGHAKINCEAGTWPGKYLDRSITAIKVANLD